ncbi:MAG: hypothetical protein GY832_13790 [Chloroflexi bacterium]|nr:hypothetical protein [Chloroflexota bacterium]
MRKSTMKQMSLVVMLVLSAVLTMGIGAQGHTLADPLTPALPPLLNSCLPGTDPGLGSFSRVYIPVVIGSGGDPSPLTCDVAEIETNDTHTDAQTMLATCVAGTALWDGDSDWYRLEVCSPVDLRILLEGSENADLDLYLYGDPPGWPLYASETIHSSDEQIAAPNLITGTYYALIQPALGQGDYVLNVRVTK